MGLFDDFMKKVQTAGKTPEQIKAQEEEDFLFHKAERDQLIKKYLTDRPAAPTPIREPQSVRMDVITRALGDKKIQDQLKAPPGVVSPGFKQAPQTMTFDETSGLGDALNTREVEPWRRGQDPSKALDDLNREAPPLGQQPERYQDDPLRGLVKEDYIPDTTIMDEEIAEATKDRKEEEKKDIEQMDQEEKEAIADAEMSTIVSKMERGGDPPKEVEKEMSQVLGKAHQGNREKEFVKFLSDNWPLAAGAITGGVLGGGLGVLGGMGAGYALKNMALEDEDLTTIGLGLAGLGDALSSAYGKKTNYLSGILDRDLKEKDLARKMKEESFIKPYLQQIKLALDLQDSIKKRGYEEDTRASEEEMRDPNSEISRKKQELILHMGPVKYAIKNPRSPWYGKHEGLAKYVKSLPVIMGTGKGAIKPLDEFIKGLLNDQKLRTEEINKIVKNEKGQAKINREEKIRADKNFRDDKKQFTKIMGNKGILPTITKWQAIDKVLGDFAFSEGYSSTPTWDWSKLSTQMTDKGQETYYNGIKFEFPRMKLWGFSSELLEGFQSPWAQALESSVQDFVNIVFKNEAGANVTGNEHSRQMKKFGDTKFSTTADWISKMKDIRQGQFRKFNLLEATFPESFFDKWKKESPGKWWNTKKMDVPYDGLKNRDMATYLKNRYPNIISAEIKRGLSLPGRSGKLWNKLSEGKRQDIAIKGIIKALNNIGPATDEASRQRRSRVLTP